MFKTIKTLGRIYLNIAEIALEREEEEEPLKYQCLEYYENWYGSRGLKFDYIVRDCPDLNVEMIIITHVYK